MNFEFSRHVREISSSEYRKFLNIGKSINLASERKKKKRCRILGIVRLNFGALKKLSSPEQFRFLRFERRFLPYQPFSKRRINRRNDFSGSRRAPVCQITRLNVPDLCVHFTTAIRAAVNHDKQGTVGAPPRGRQRDNEASLLSAASQTLRPALIASIIIPWNG